MAFKRCLSRRMEAARAAISPSISSIPNPDKSTSARFKPVPCPLERTSIQTARLTHILPNSAARRSSVRACGMPRRVSIKMLLSKVKLLKGLRALLFYLEPYFLGRTKACQTKEIRRLTLVHSQPTKPCATHALDHPPHRKDQETQPELQGNQNPKGALMKHARVVAIRLHRRCPRDLSTHRNPDLSSQEVLGDDKQRPLRAKLRRETCPAWQQADRAT